MVGDTGVVPCPASHALEDLPYALRALAREWRDWCDTHLITGADAFLGSHASYLLNTLLCSDGRPEGARRRRAGSSRVLGARA